MIYKSNPLVMKEKCVIYCRVSSKEQEETGYSLPSQEKLLTEYANRKGFTILKTFSVAESASGAKQRKIFGEMMDYMKRYKTSILLCEKVDRLTRNLKEAVTVNDWVESDDKRQIHFVKQNLVIHKNAKSDEKFRWDIEIVLAKKFISNLSEEVKKGQKEKIAQGWLPTKPPLGYKTIGEKGKKIHVIDEEKAPFIKKMFELYASGEYPVERLSNKMYKEGLRTRGGYKLARSRLANLLLDPFYIGKNRWKNVITNGNQEPLISAELFDKVQEVAGKKVHPKYRTHDFLFKGLVLCKECGGLLTWERQKGTIYGHCNQYRACTKRPWYKESDFEKIISSEFSKLKLSNNRLAEWIKKAIKELHKTETGYRDSALAELQNRQSRLRQQQNIIYSDRLDGRITPEFYDEKQKSLSSELQGITEAITRHSEADRRYFELGINIFELSQQAGILFTKARPEDKRRLLRLICEEMFVENNVLTVQFTEAFNSLSQIITNINNSKMPEKLLSPLRIFELDKYGSVKASKGSSDQQMITGLLG